MELKQLITKLPTDASSTQIPSRASVEKFEKLLETKNEHFWQRSGEAKALALFHKAAEEIPAYKDFLKQNGLDHKEIHDIGDFVKVPITDKKNYIYAYPLAERCWNGKLSDSAIIAASSGTSGQSTFWPRSKYQEFEAQIIHELIYRYLFKTPEKNTLFLICFPMGVYVSGVATALPSWLTAINEDNVTCITVGNNKSEALKVLQDLGKEFEQIVIVGHPFFIKDMLETGAQSGLDWSKPKIKLMFCSGGFNELWRQYLMKLAKIPDPTGIISTYGSSEMLLIGHETPLSIYAREQMETEPRLRDSLQEPNLIPNLFQYNPLIRYIETVNNELIFTSASGIPLIRFNLHDKGETIGFDQMTENLNSIKASWREELGRLSKENYPNWNLPFVSLYGRSDYTLKFYAANIYPEHIQIALSQADLFDKLTGKYVMSKGYTESMDEYLEINVELREKINADQSLTDELQKNITDCLLQINREYADTSRHHPDKDLKPRVILRPYQDDKHFKVGLKPKFIA